MLILELRNATENKNSLHGCNSKTVKKKNTINNLNREHLMWKIVK